MKKILYGICGIGHGHIHRQKPIIEELSKKNKIVIFAYGESLKFCLNTYGNLENIKVIEVAVPYLVGNKFGIDWKETENSEENKKDFSIINARAFFEAKNFLGKTDLVVTDYEPVSAQYSYAFSVPLITFDQQSKFLQGDLPQIIGDTSFKDEIERLSMFFPKVDLRLASSFFMVKEKLASKNSFDVNIVGPIIRGNVRKIVRKKSNTVLVYLTSQGNSFDEFKKQLSVLKNFKDWKFKIFSGKVESSYEDVNVEWCQHDEVRFLDALAECSGIIATAGHTLLSEAMYLGIPVMAVPLNLYEQELSGNVIKEAGFGLSCKKIEEENIEVFLSNLDKYSENIKKDTTVLIRQDGVGEALSAIGKFLV